MNTQEQAAFDLMREALIKVARMAEALKRDCGMDPESKQAIRNGEYMSISYVAREALAAAKEVSEPMKVTDLGRYALEPQAQGEAS